uniref:Uncharacterized protein n=1 Tax=Knipowitschia caucasica TaxID=637954 RepID=A0AAV2JRW9_KNICA
MLWVVGQRHNSSASALATDTTTLSADKTYLPGHGTTQSSYRHKEAGNRLFRSVNTRLCSTLGSGGTRDRDGHRSDPDSHRTDRPHTLHAWSNSVRSLLQIEINTMDYLDVPY